ncbi:MAG TPA: CcmD family protein [Polyangiaceae bacterium]|nr:CcmD family protein [Polyangiaceae bacterium]
MSQAERSPSKTETPPDAIDGQATSEGGPSTEFRPVEGGGNTKSGEMLLVQAYAAFWLFAFGLIVFSLRKQKKLDERIARLEDDLNEAREAS